MGNSPTPSPPGRAQRPEERDPTWSQRVKARLFAWLIWVLAYLPSAVSYGIAWCLAPLLVWGARRRDRKVSSKGRGLVRNQRIAFRDRWSESFSDELLWAWARHMTATFVDVCRMRRMHPGNVRELVDTTDLDNVLKPLQDEGHGVLCAAGHMGIWELCGHVTSLCGLPSVSVSRPNKNRALNDVLRKLRTSGGQQILDKWGVLWSLRKAVARGELVGIAADENDPSRGVFVPCMGTLAATNTTPAFLAGRTGAPIAVVSCQRVGRGRFKFHVWDVIRVPKGHSSDRDLEGITATISAAVSRAILAYPEQWLWGSRRYTSRPNGEVPGPDGLPPTAEPWPRWTPSEPPANASSAGQRNR